MPDPEFAEYQPSRPPRPPVPFVVRAGTSQDAAAVAAIDAQRARVPVGDLAQRVRLELLLAEHGDPLRMVLVAEVAGRVVAYGRAAHQEHGGAIAARTAPTGWYLTGVVVEPTSRRLGIARALTAERLRLLEQRGAGEVFYFANSRNAPTVDLHAALGFTLVAEGVAVPGVVFHGGVGMLYARRIASGHRAPGSDDSHP
jgi:ribosomal protein S18 acetylase RimI-like enzyme